MSTEIQSPVNRQQLLSWPSAVVVLLLAWGYLATVPRLDSQRPKEGATATLPVLGLQSLPARLWQDPLEVAYTAAAQDASMAATKEATDKPASAGKSAGSTKLGGTAEFKRMIEAAKKKAAAQVTRVVRLGVCVSGNRYPEGAEQCRRYRNAVLSALCVAGFVPLRSDGLGYFAVPRPQSAGDGGHTSGASEAAGVGLSSTAALARHLIIPFEWFEPSSAILKKDSALVFVHWIDESRIDHAPLACLNEVSEFLKASDHNVDREYTVLGPTSSSTLGAIWRECEQWHDPPHVEFMSTGATAPRTRQPLRDADALPIVPNSSPLKVTHLIGDDKQLAQALAQELILRQIKLTDHVAIIAERDTHYGRNMLENFCEAFKNALGSTSASLKLKSYSYFRGVDGYIPGQKGREAESASMYGSEAPQDRVVGGAQLDYVRRLVHDLRRDSDRAKDSRLKAIGIVGSDVYDKLLLLRALRYEFPDAVLFTTDLDDRLLQRSEYRSTHNLVIASHYGLRLHSGLQCDVPPFRDSYQASLFVGCMRVISERNLLTPSAPETECDVASALADFDPVNSSTTYFGGKALVVDRSLQEALIFEVGRTGAYDLGSINFNKQTPDRRQHAIHSSSHRWRHSLGWLPARKWIVATLLLVACLLPFSRLLQSRLTHARLVTQSWQLRFAGVAASAGVVLAALIAYDHCRLNGEPFALAEGISVWPTIYLRLIIVMYCAYFVLRTRDAMSASIQYINVSVFGQTDRSTGSSSARGTGGPLPKRLGSKWRQAGTSLAAPSQELKRWFRMAVENCNWNWNGGDGESPAGNAQAAGKRAICALGLWRDYVQRGTDLRRHGRFVPHLAMTVAFIGALFWIYGLAIVPVRGDFSRLATLFSFVFCGVAILWVIFYVMDIIRLCGRFLAILDSKKLDWPDDSIERAAQEVGLPSWVSADGDCRQIIGRFIEMKLIARHTDAIATIIYGPSIAIAIWFVSRISLFDNWSWSPPIIGAFLVALTIDLYSAWAMGRASIQARDKAIDSVTEWIERLPPDHEVRAPGTRVLRRIRDLRSAAFLPLRNQPPIRAALVPFGSLGTLSVIEQMVRFLGP